MSPYYWKMSNGRGALQWGGIVGLLSSHGAPIGCLDACFEVHHLTARTGARLRLRQRICEQDPGGLASVHAEQLGTLPVILTPAPPREAAVGANQWLFEAASGAGLQIVPIHLGSDIVQTGRASPDTTTAGGGAGEPTAGRHSRGAAADDGLAVCGCEGFQSVKRNRTDYVRASFWETSRGLLHSSPAAARDAANVGRRSVSFTFERIEDAGMFALDLADLVEATDWLQLGLPADLSIRNWPACGTGVRMP